MYSMKQFLRRFFFSKKDLEIGYDTKDMVKFYIQLHKMKKKRPHINPSRLLYKCYPNAKIIIQEIIKNHEDSIN